MGGPVAVAADPAVLEVEFRHVHGLLDPAAPGLHRWVVEVRAGGESVGVLRAVRGLYWRSGNLRERLGDESSFLAAVSSVLLDPDGTFSPGFEAAVDMPGNVLVIEGLELSGPWADPLIAASLVSSLIDRLADYGSAVILPRAGADVAGAVLLDEAGALLAGEEFGEDLRIIDTAMAAPEEAAHQVQQLLKERSRTGGRTLPDSDDEDAWDDLDDEEGGWTLTARTRAVLRLALEDLAATACAEAAALGDEVMTAQAAGLFASLPRITFHQDAAWRRQMARTFDDLAADLDTGKDLAPGCTGEEMALHLAISRAEDLQRNRPRLVADAVHGLPADPYDFAWDDCSNLLFEDHDVLMLFDGRLDGIEDPEGDVGQAFGMVNLAPLEWFSPFDPSHARDPERGFHRD